MAHRLKTVNSCTLFYCAVRTCTIGVDLIWSPQHSIIALFCMNPFLLWLKVVWRSVCNQSNDSLLFFFFSTSLYVVGIVATATLTLPARVVNESESPWSLVSISSYSSVSPWSGQRCSSNKRKRATLIWDPSHMMWSCRLHAFVGKVRQSWGRFKWPTGLGIRPEACVYVYKTGLGGWPSHNQQTPCLLPFVYPLALQSWQNFNEFYSPGCYQNDGGVSDYLPMDSLFCESILCWGSLCFPFAELELFIASLRKDKTK